MAAVAGRRRMRRATETLLLATLSRHSYFPSPSYQHLAVDRRPLRVGAVTTCGSGASCAHHPPYPTAPSPPPDMPTPHSSTCSCGWCDHSLTPVTTPLPFVAWGCLHPPWTRHRLHTHHLVPAACCAEPATGPALHTPRSTTAWHPVYATRHRTAQHCPGWQAAGLRRLDTYHWLLLRYSPRTYARTTTFPPHPTPPHRCPTRTFSPPHARRHSCLPFTPTAAACCTAWHACCTCTFSPMGSVLGYRWRHRRAFLVLRTCYLVNA